MRRDSATIARFMQTYAQSGQFNKGKQLHAQLICAAMITGFSQNKRFTETLETFCLMRNACKSPNQFAFSSVVRAGAALGWIEFGRQMHCLLLKCSFSYELFVGSNLADMYSKCGSIVEACKVFEEMPCKDEVSWTTMIDGYAKSGDFKEALLAYKRMINDGLVIDQHVLCSTLNACGALKACKFGKSLHSSVVKLGFELETAVGNALMNVYLKVGDMENALNVFGTEPEGRNIVSYTSFINGYVEANQIEKAFDVFSDLQMHEIEPNEYTFSSLIKACANQAALEQGIQLHAQVFKFNMDSDPYVSSILVDMYGKCGLLDDSIRVFEEIGEPTEIAWNSLVSVFAQHGLGKDAIETFDRMIQNGLKPNGITFVSLLTACSHAGLADEGLKYFHSMEKTYGVVPGEEHYSCVIDLLGRSGKLKEAEECINNMPIEPSAFIWCSFLGACRTYGDKERGKLAAEKLMKLEPENSGAHVLLSNIYAKQKQWNDVSRLRKMMRDDNVKKLPGYSWVDVGNKTHIFGAEDWTHPRKKEIYEKLDSLFDQIRKAGYVPYTDSIPFDMDKSIKEKILHHHSERIALAFALISIPAGKPIIVKKNIRVCVDCHSAFKCISKVVGRKIVLRDNRRFHHFAEGFCSCGDYW